MVRLTVTPSPHVKYAMNLVLNSFRSQYTPNAVHQPLYEPEPQPQFYSMPHAQAHTQPQPAQSVPSCNMTPNEWDVLFHAVLVRLENSVSDELGKTPEPLWEHSSKSTKTSVLDCVAALRQLHDASTTVRHT